MAYRRSKPSVGVQLVQGVPVVGWVRNDLAAQIPLGSQISRIDGMDVFEVARQRALRVAASTVHTRLDMAVSRVLEGARGSMVSIDYVTPSGESRTGRFECGDAWPEGTRLLFLQNLAKTRTEFKLFDDGRIAYFAARDFRDIEVHSAFAAHLAELQNSRAVVIDVRTNSGGQSRVGYAILAHFLTRPMAEGGSRVVKPTAGHAELTELSPNIIEPAPAPQRIAARLVLLTSLDTVSAAEEFVSLASASGAVRVGTTTAGSTGEMARTTLPGGGTLFVLSKWDRGASGEEFVGNGLPPQELVEPSVPELLAGQDPILQRGLMVARRLTARN
jgi:C-terminal processing protease CtpA/Prc